MKKIIFVLVILAGVLLLYMYSAARNRIFLPMPENMKGKESSQLKEINKPTATATKGSGDLKVTGPVWSDK